MVRLIKLAFLILGDIGVFYVSLLIALSLRYGGYSSNVWGLHFVPFSIVFAFWIVIFYSQNLYSFPLFRNRVRFYENLFRALIINALSAIVFFYFIPLFKIAPKTNLFLTLLASSILFVVWRSFYNRIVKIHAFSQNILFIGINNELKPLLAHLETNPQLGFKAKGAILLEKSLLELQHAIPLFSADDNIREIIKKQRITTVCLVSEPRVHPALSQKLYACLSLPVRFVDFASFYEYIFRKIPLSILEEQWFLKNLNQRERFAEDALKRVFDIISASLLLFITLPLWPLIGLLIKLDSPGPVFFTQKRMGKNGNLFTVIKFRTMRHKKEYEGPTNETSRDPRITRVGMALRKTYLDELPQLVSILKNDMSLVGPRPEWSDLAERFVQEIPHYHTRHMVKPGLTGWAQINLPYGSSREYAIERLAHELYYIKNRSLAFDIAILIKTLNSILAKH